MRRFVWTSKNCLKIFVKRIITHYTKRPHDLIGSQVETTAHRPHWVWNYDLWSQFLGYVHVVMEPPRRYHPLSTLLPPGIFFGVNLTNNVPVIKYRVPPCGEQISRAYFPILSSYFFHSPLLKPAICGTQLV